MKSESTASVAAHWAALCDHIKLAGQDILASAEGLDSVSQGEGLRYLTRLLRGAFEKYLEFSDPLDPSFFKMSDARNKYGGDNPDNSYSASPISDLEEYEIRGSRGSIQHFNFSIFNWEPNGRWNLTGIREGHEIACDPDGNFSLTLGGTPRDGNWLALPKGSNLVLLRQTFVDRNAEVEVQANIQLTTTATRVGGLTVEQALLRLRSADSFFCDTGRLMHTWSKALALQSNQLIAADPKLIASGGGDPNVFYYWCSWKLGEDQALLVQLPDYPADKNWNLVLYNYWLESLDYSHFQIHLNSKTAQRNADGSITLVIANADPGMPNWLNRCDHQQGQLMLRCWSGGVRPTDPLTQMIDLKATNLTAKYRRWSS
jgi:hypothetical protein